MKVLVTGAGGMLGQDVVSAARDAGDEVVALARAALDVTDPDAVASAIASAGADVVVNCAAWTNVDLAQEDPAGAAAVNQTAAGHVARAAAAAGVRLVHVSTDYVFDGLAAVPYVESAETRPLGVYGATKRAGELAIEAAGGAHAIVRSSWLFGVEGRNFVATMLGLAAGRDEVEVVTDQIGCPTSTADLAVALLELARGDACGVFHVVGGGAPVSWHDFAVEIFRQAGTGTRVVPVTSEQMLRPAPRPAFSVLASERPEAPVLPPWQDGLANYLIARKVIHA